MATNVTGATGELIDRLITLTNWSPDEDPNMWITLGMVLQIHIGGNVLGLQPESGIPYPPGSMGAMLAERYTVLPRPEYFDRIASRLRDIVGDGLSEHVLVGGLLVELDEWVEHGAKVGEANEKRARFRQFLRDLADDPSLRERFRAGLVESGPESADLPDDELVETISGMAERELLDPIPADEADRRRAALAGWSARRDDLLPNRIVHEWFDAHMRGTIPR